MINLDDWDEYRKSNNLVSAAKHQIEAAPDKSRLVRQGLLYCLSIGRIVKEDVDTAKKLAESAL
mgnify:CR=1 FL=1